MARITIVISSYKYGHLAAHCIDSVISQTRKPDKIFFVDDGVGDCGHLVDIYPELTFILRPENLGIVANFQDMLERVETDYVMFLGADNWLRQDALEVLMEDPADITMYDIVVVGEYADEIVKRHQNEVEPYEGGYYWDRSSGHHGSMLYNVELGKQIGYQSPPGRTIEDLHMYNGILNLGGTKKHIEKPLLYYRRHRENYNAVR